MHFIWRAKQHRFSMWVVQRKCSDRYGNTSLFSQKAPKSKSFKCAHQSPWSGGERAGRMKSCRRTCKRKSLQIISPLGWLELTNSMVPVSKSCPLKLCTSLCLFLLDLILRLPVTPSVFVCVIGRVDIKGKKCVQ